MSEGARIETLQAKHAELEDALHSEELKPQPDTVTVAELKKQKLRLKDEMARIDAHA